jgi:penicillin-binding protein 1A
MVGVAWIGYDQPKTLGTNETGAVAALPIWIGFMGKALKGVPESTLPMPEGVVAIKVNVDTGLRDDASTLTEFFYSEFPPRSRDDSLSPSGQPGKDIRDQLF